MKPGEHRINVTNLHQQANTALHLRDLAIKAAHDAGYTLKEIGTWINLHESTISRIITRLTT